MHIWRFHAGLTPTGFLRKWPRRDRRLRFQSSDSVRGVVPGTTGLTPRSSQLSQSLSEDFVSSLQTRTVTPTWRSSSHTGSWPNLTEMFGCASSRFPMAIKANSTSVLYFCIFAVSLKYTFCTFPFCACASNRTGYSSTYVLMPLQSEQSFVVGRNMSITIPIFFHLTAGCKHTILLSNQTIWALLWAVWWLPGWCFVSATCCFMNLSNRNTWSSPQSTIKIESLQVIGPPHEHFESFWFTFTTGGNSINLPFGFLNLPYKNSMNDCFEVAWVFSLQRSSNDYTTFRHYK